jgi:hypothetical protein
MKMNVAAHKLDLEFGLSELDLYHNLLVSPYPLIRNLVLHIKVDEKSKPTIDWFQSICKDTSLYRGTVELNYHGIRLFVSSSYIVYEPKPRSFPALAEYADLIFHTAVIRAFIGDAELSDKDFILKMRELNVIASFSSTVYTRFYEATL